MNLELKAASIRDIDLLLQFMAGFNQEEKIPCDREVYRTRIVVAFDSPQYVMIWLIVTNARAVGYAILTFTFSFEFGGTLATIDEIYITPERRGKGLGTSVLKLVEREAAYRRATTICADVSDKKPQLIDFYKRFGFECYPYRAYYKSIAAKTID